MLYLLGVDGGFVVFRTGADDDGGVVVMGRSPV